MIHRINIAIITLLSCLTAASAHEVWLDATAFKVEPGQKYQAALRNGENFLGSSQIYNPRGFTRFDHWDGVTLAPVPGRPGDRPAVQIYAKTPGLNALIFESNSASLTYREMEKFEAFVTHKDFAGAIEQHRARGFPESGFKELYSRHVKMLFCVSTCTGTDQSQGLQTEIIALSNPYDPKLTLLPVQVRYLGSPVPDRQVEIFAKSAEGEVDVSLSRTNAQGVALIPLQRNTTYLLDSVTLREPSPEVGVETGAVWETLWAALTFRTPEAQ